MQERYLGDIHDYYKFLFLKNLSTYFKLIVGCNWYLVNPENIGQKELQKNDGEKRNYLLGDKKLKDDILVKELMPLRNIKNRVLKSFVKKTHLQKYIKFYNKLLTHKNREKWFNQSLQKTEECEYIFLDPDNGLISGESKISPRKKIKYILTNEIKEMYENGKNIIFCQFQSFNKNHKDMLINKKNIIKTEIELDIHNLILRNRVSPNTFFISLLQKGNEERFNNFLTTFSEKVDKVEVVKV